MKLGRGRWKDAGDRQDAPRGPACTDTDSRGCGWEWAILVEWGVWLWHGRGGVQDRKAVTKVRRWQLPCLPDLVEGEEGPAYVTKEAQHYPWSRNVAHRGRLSWSAAGYFLNQPQSTRSPCRAAPALLSGSTLAVWLRGRHPRGTRGDPSHRGCVACPS